MTAFKLHHTKFYTRHTGETNGLPHCYRCDEILQFDNRVWVAMAPHGFVLPNAAQLPDDAFDDEIESEGNTLVMMGATCALKAISGK